MAVKNRNLYETVVYLYKSKFSSLLVLWERRFIVFCSLLGLSLVISICCSIEVVDEMKNSDGFQCSTYSMLCANKTSIYENKRTFDNRRARTAKNRIENDHWVRFLKRWYESWILSSQIISNFDVWKPG